MPESVSIVVSLHWYVQAAWRIVFQTSTPITNPINTPLPDSGEISWDSDIGLKSKAITKQPNSSISPVLVDKISDKPSPSYSDAEFVKKIVLDLHASSFAANDNIGIATAAAPDVIITPVVQNSSPIQLVIQGPVVQDEVAGVGINPVIPDPVVIYPAPAVPDPVGAQPVSIVLDFADIQPAPVAQGPNIVQFVAPIVQDGNVNNDSSDEESIEMTDSVIAPPTFNGKASQDPSDWLRHL